MATGRRVSGTPGTGFVGLSDWAQANSGAYDALAQRLASGVEAEGQSAQQGLDNLGRDFYNRMTGGAVRYYPGVNSTQAANYAQRGYTGPDALSDMEGYENAMGAADRAGRNARRVGDIYGRATALQDMAGNTDYSQGQQLLDSALTGRAGGSRFAQLGQQWGGLFGRAQDLERTASNRAGQTRQTSEEARQRYAGDVPRLRNEEEQVRVAADEAYNTEQERLQDERERRGGRAGDEGGGKRPGRTYGTLDDWGKGGAWG